MFKNIFRLIVNPVETKFASLTPNLNRSIFGLNYVKNAILTYFGAKIAPYFSKKKIENVQITFLG